MCGLTGNNDFKRLKLRRLFLFCFSFFFSFFLSFFLLLFFCSIFFFFLSFLLLLLLLLLLLTPPGKSTAVKVRVTELLTFRFMVVYISAGINF